MKKYNRKPDTILFMAQLPPPVHGAALRNKSLLDSPLLNTNFTIVSLPLKFVDNMKELGKFSVRKILLTIRHAFIMLRVFSYRKIDVVYFTMSSSGGSFYRDIFFISIIKLFRKKRILHFRKRGISQTAKSWLGKSLVKFAFRGSEVVCLSHHHMLDVEKFVENAPYIVPNGIKVEGNSDKSPDTPALSPSQKVRLLFLSNLSKTKGVTDLIEALSLLKEKSYEFSADLVGNEWDLGFKQVQTLIDEAHLTEMVFIAGPKYGDDKFDCIRRADIFVFPTFFELFPGVILEAMQYGKAIVSTFEGSIPEIIDDRINGLLVEQRNTERLADAIAFMIDHPDERKHMAELARKKFFEKFTLQAFEQQMNIVFKKVLEKSHTS